MKSKAQIFKATPSKREFEAFEFVRQGGVWNMLTQARSAAASAGLTLARYMVVLRNYDLCVKKWPEVRA